MPVLIGTPGRILDLMDRGVLKHENIKLVVFDGVESLTVNKMWKKVSKILVKFSKETQFVFEDTCVEYCMKKICSVCELTERTVSPAEWLIPGSWHYNVMVEKEEHKFETLVDILDSTDFRSCIIFCTTKLKVNWLAESLQKKSFPVKSLHGDLTQSERDKTRIAFANGEIRILVTVGTAGGCQNGPISLVINYDCPHDYHHYVTQSGFAGRRHIGYTITFFKLEDKTTQNLLEKWVPFEEFPGGSKLPQMERSEKMERI